MQYGEWVRLPRSQRLHLGRFTCDAWEVGEGVMYTILDETTCIYVKGGKCNTWESAKEVSSALAGSLLDAVRS